MPPGPGRVPAELAVTSGVARPSTERAARTPSTPRAEAGQSQPSEADRRRYVELYKRKQRAERLNALWKVEAELSAKRTAYAVLDLSEKKLYFKVRGRVFKAIPISALEAHRSSRPVQMEELAWKAFTLQIKEGKGVETESIQRKTLTAAEAALSGRGGAEDEPIGAEQGVASAESALEPGTAATDGDDTSDPAKVAGVAGGLIPPDPPPKYHMGFDGGLSLWVEAEVPSTPKAARFETLIALAKRIGRLITGSAEARNETRIILHVPLSQGQQIYRQLLPGQRLLVTL